MSVRNALNRLRKAFGIKLKSRTIVLFYVVDRLVNRTLFLCSFAAFLVVSALDLPWQGPKNEVKNFDLNLKQNT